MKYLIILIVTFAVYFWAMHNIGDKYVVTREPYLPPQLPKEQTDLYEGKITPDQYVEKTKSDTEGYTYVEY